MMRKKSILIPLMIFIAVMLLLMVLMVFFRESETALLYLLSGAIVFLLAGAVFVVFGVITPVIDLKQKLNALSQAAPVPDEPAGSFREFREMDSAIELHLQRLKEIIAIVNNLSEGDIQDDIEAIGEHDALGHAMVKLKESIIRSNQEAKNRQKHDEQQNWASRGLAKFGEMMRDLEQGITEFSGHFIRELTQYVDMEVGGVFFLQHDQSHEPVLELFGAYAFDRQKSADISFRPGEGLVGRCALEKESIVITDVPEDYIRIRSGMGEGKPSAIILVPMMFDGQVLGVIELASFNMVEQYKIAFLETLGSSLASILSKTGTTPS
jgi:putative methionine-R-sulfoxide reductase with GAF domain